MADYGTRALLLKYLPQVNDNDLLDQLLTRSSRMVDRVCQLPDDFFAPAGGSATAKVFVGTGIQQLSLMPFVAGSLAATGAVTVENESGTVEYRLRDGRYLLRHTDDALWQWGEPDDHDWQRRNGRRKPVWPDGKRVTVTARWGWSATPDDIVNATLEIAGTIYRQNPERQLSLDTGDEQVREAAISVRARELRRIYAVWEENDAE